MEAAPVCSRLGCGGHAVAVFGFDARASLVWLDPIAARGRGAGMLCGWHADRLSPPRGWNLLDRRAPEARLWTGRPASAAAVIHSPRRERPARSRACAAADPLLPFDGSAQSPGVDPVLPADPAPSWSPHDRPGADLEHVLDARTPMLARAFQAARSDRA